MAAETVTTMFPKPCFFMAWQAYFPEEEDTAEITLVTFIPLCLGDIFRAAAAPLHRGSSTGPHWRT